MEEFSVLHCRGDKNKDDQWDSTVTTTCQHGPQSEAAETPPMSGAAATTSPALLPAHSSSGPSAGASKNDSDIVPWEAFSRRSHNTKVKSRPVSTWVAFKFDSSRLCVRSNLVELDFLKGDSPGNDGIANVTASWRGNNSIVVAPVQFSAALPHTTHFQLSTQFACFHSLGCHTACGPPCVREPAPVSASSVSNPLVMTHIEPLKWSKANLSLWSVGIDVFWKVNSNIVFKQVEDAIPFILKKRHIVLWREKSSVTPHAPDHIQRVISNLFQLGSYFIRFNRLSFLLITRVAPTNARAAKVQPPLSIQLSGTKLNTLIDISPRDMTDFCKCRTVIKKKDKKISCICLFVQILH